MSFKFICENLCSKLKAINLKNVTTLPVNSLHTSAVAAGKINRMKDRKSLMRTVVKKDDGTQGERSVDVDSIVKRFALVNY